MWIYPSYHLAGDSPLSFDVGYLLTAAPVLTVLLGFFFCSWTWDISTWPIQRSTAMVPDLGHGVSLHSCSSEVQEPLLTLDIGYLLMAAREWKNWLNAQHSENKDYGIWSHHFMANRWRDSGNFIFWGSKITADGDCSHEIKRCLLLGRKVMTNLDSILKNKDITLPTKVHLFKAWFF